MRSISDAFMRVATWNLQRPKPQDEALNQARLRKIVEIDADIWILTETHEAIDLSDSHHGAATSLSPRKPEPGESCATIWSRWPILRRIPTVDPTEAVCVEVDHPNGPLLIYGSIIAYAGYKGPDGKSAPWAQHYQYINWHGEDWSRIRKVYSEHPLIAGGDYNQNRDGAVWYGTHKGRQLLTTVLTEAGLACVTEEDFVASGKLQTRHSVDHICVDLKLAAKVKEVIPWEAGNLDGVMLSDHNGLLVIISD